MARSGYSTVMELAEVRKKALFVPTPGQTEQEYLAQRYRDLGWFHSVPQQELDLKRDSGTAASCSGIPHVFSTAETLKNIMPLLTGAVSG